MPEFLRTTLAADTKLDWAHVVFVQVVALLLGIAVALVYRFTRGPNGQERQSLMATLVLLTLLIAMISSIIGDNVARAFSLVGALSIVRFRTVVEDTRDTAFVILAVGVGMALGAGFFFLPILLIPMAGLAAWMFGPKQNNPGGGRFEAQIRLGLDVDDSSIRQILSEVDPKVKVSGASTFRQGIGTEMSYQFLVQDSTGLQDLYRRLKSLEGVASVDLKKA